MRLVKFPGRDSNQALAEYKSEALPTEQVCTVTRRHNPQQNNMDLHRRENLSPQDENVLEKRHKPLFLQC
jgi:hypothetical protein